MIYKINLSAPQYYSAESTTPLSINGGQNQGCPATWVGIVDIHLWQQLLYPVYVPQFCSPQESNAVLVVLVDLIGRKLYLHCGRYRFPI